MIYWVKSSIGPSFLTCYDFANAGALTWIKTGMKKRVGSSSVPSAFALFPADISRRRAMGRAFLQRTTMDRDAARRHFAATEEPELADDIRTWFR